MLLFSLSAVFAALIVLYVVVIRYWPEHEGRPLPVVPLEESAVTLHPMEEAEVPPRGREPESFAILAPPSAPLGTSRVRGATVNRSARLFRRLDGAARRSGIRMTQYAEAGGLAELHVVWDGDGPRDKWKSLTTPAVEDAALEVRQVRDLYWSREESGGFAWHSDLHISAMASTISDDDADSSASLAQAR
jgi:hypothetical protein